MSTQIGTISSWTTIVPGRAKRPPTSNRPEPACPQLVKPASSFLAFSMDSSSYSCYLRIPTYTNNEIIAHVSRMVLFEGHTMLFMDPGRWSARVLGLSSESPPILPTYWYLRLRGISLVKEPKVLQRRSCSGNFRVGLKVGPWSLDSSPLCHRIPAKRHVDMANLISINRLRV